MGNKGKRIYDIKQISKAQFVVEENLPYPAVDPEVSPVFKTRAEAVTFMEELKKEGK